MFTLSPPLTVPTGLQYNRVNYSWKKWNTQDISEGDWKSEGKIKSSSLEGFEATGTYSKC